MRTPRKTVTAVIVSTVLVLATGLVAATTILDLRGPGLTTAAADNAAPVPTGTPQPSSTAAPQADDGPMAAAPRTTSPPPGPTGGGGALGGMASVVAADTSPGAPVAGPAPVVNIPVVNIPAPTAAPTPARTSPQDEGEHVTPTPTGGTIPPPPAGCREAEWDSEHRYWKCAGSGEDD